MLFLCGLGTLRDQCHYNNIRVCIVLYCSNAPILIFVFVLYCINATIIIFVFVLYCINATIIIFVFVLYCIVLMPL